MVRVRVLKNSFSGGEISPYLRARGDLKAYENGMAKLRNVLVLPTGGIRRRPGLRFLDQLPGKARLIAFEFNIEQVYVLVFTHLKMSVYRDGIKTAEVDTPWQESQLQQLIWTQSADSLLMVHPDVPPRQIQRQSHADWTIENWKFYEDEEGGKVFQPYYKFAKDDVTLAPSGTVVGNTVTLTASADVFHTDHVETRLRLQKKEVLVTEYVSPTQVKAVIKDKNGLASTIATKDWEEQSFSPVRGWPVCVVFHQDRLVIGGSRDLPNRLWMSKSADLFNFDLGEGLDDEAIEFAILSDQVNAVRALFSSRHLQVFTSGAEWMVTGDPLTPENIQLKRQTRIGSAVTHFVPPRNVDGATLFTSRDGQDLREFLYADMEQAYQSNDLAMLCKHLLNTPQDQDYDSTNRIFYMVMGDGTLGALTVYRAEKISAWSLLETKGSFRSLCVAGGQVYVSVERENKICLEVFDSDCHSDSTLIGEDSDGTFVWQGLDHLEGQEVVIVADGGIVQEQNINNGQVELFHRSYEAQIGLPYAHVVEPLPPSPHVSGNASQGGCFRLVSLSLRLFETRCLRLDVGRGLKDVPFRRMGNGFVLDQPMAAFSGDVSIRALGWRRDGTKGLWRIEQTAPASFCILSLLEEISANA